MDSEIRDTKNEPEGFVDLLNYWFQPFVKGMMFGIGHYLTLYSLCFRVLRV